MTRFFIPRFEKDRAGAERVYDDLRASAEETSGEVAHRRRIQSIRYRRGGTDCTIDVGDADFDGRIVLAIFQVGRAAFTIHSESANGDHRRSAVEVSRRTVYDVTDFDA